MNDGAAAGGKLSAGDGDPYSRRELVDRVISSPAFQKSSRLREMLLFLCDRALSNPNVIIREQDIGVEVFGRPANYDTNVDNLVRVQAGHLRRKLQQHFAAEGLSEPVIIDIPKGAYTPVFRTRESTSRNERHPDTPDEDCPPKRNRLTIVVALVAAAGLCTSGWLGWRLFRSAEAARYGGGKAPTVNRLWRQMFANGLATCMVLSDANLTIFEDMIERQLTVKEYNNRDFAYLVDMLLADSERKKVARDLMSRPFTHFADARLAGQFEGLNAAHQIPTSILFARSFTTNYLESHNAILLGTRRANPWLELFEGQLNFRARFDEKPPLAYFQNMSPRTGESATYAVDWGNRGYCRVAYLPNLNRTGSALVISGTDLASTEAGGQFISTERTARTLGSVLGVREGDRFPFFEVLLKVDFLASTTARYEVVAHRVY